MCEPHPIFKGARVVDNLHSHQSDVCLQRPFTDLEGLSPETKDHACLPANILPESHVHQDRGVLEVEVLLGCDAPELHEKLFSGPAIASRNSCVLLSPTM